MIMYLSVNGVPLLVHNGPKWLLNDIIIDYYTVLSFLPVASIRHSSMRFSSFFILKRFLLFKIDEVFRPNLCSVKFLTKHQPWLRLWLIFYLWWWKSLVLPIVLFPPHRAYIVTSTGTNLVLSICRYAIIIGGKVLYCQERLTAPSTHGKQYHITVRSWHHFIQAKAQRNQFFLSLPSSQKRKLKSSMLVFILVLRNFSSLIS